LKNLNVIQMTNIFKNLHLMSFVFIIIFTSCSNDSENFSIIIVDENKENYNYIQNTAIDHFGYKETEFTQQYNEIFLLTTEISDIDIVVNDYNNPVTILEITPSTFGINQNNNIIFTGFSVFIHDYLFFADTKGIHRTNKDFDELITIVENEHFREDRTGDLFDLGWLQYYNGFIYFLDRINSIIYKVDMYGNNLTVVLSVNRFIADDSTHSHHHHDDSIKISEFIISNNQIYFVQVNHGSAMLMIFDLEKDDFIDTHLFDAIIPSLSNNENYVYFSQDFLWLRRFDRINSKVSDIIPKNRLELQESLNITIYLTYRTTSKEFIIFTLPVSDGGTYLLRINEDGYASIIHTSEEFILSTINAFNEWIYFVTRRRNPENRGDSTSHLYRIKNDGTNLERVFSNLPNENIFVPEVFLNIFSEDFILFKVHPVMHNIYALVRNQITHEMEIKLINPVTYN